MKIINSILKFSLFVFVINIAVSFANEPLSETQYKVIVAKKVYTTIVRSIGDGRQSPEFQILRIDPASSMKIAWYNPNERSVVLDEKAYDLCTHFGADSLNAIAAILGHELAHFYKDHGWASDFGNAFADLSVGKTIKSAQQRIELETQADDFGGFFCQLAGYHTFDLEPRVLDSVYTAFSLGPQLNGYPSLTERKEIAKRSADKLQQYVPIFEAGIRLLLVQEYQFAAVMFDMIAQTFPSREILNNAGIARALEVVQAMDKKQAHFAYPFELDARTRLEKPKSRGEASLDKDQIEQLLGEAQEKLEEAVKKDPQYAAGFVNLSCIQNLLGEYQDGEYDYARGSAKEAMKLARSQNDSLTLGLAFVAQGITSAKDNDSVQAYDEFNYARGLTPLAQINIDILTHVKLKDQPSVKLKNKKLQEEIAGYPIKNDTLFSSISQTLCLPSLDCSNVAGETTTMKSKIEIRNGDTWRAMRVTRDKSTSVFINTGEGYSGASAQEIKKGSTVGELTAGYGEAESIFPNLQGMYYIYYQPEIVFHTNLDGNVDGWFLYSTQP